MLGIIGAMLEEVEFIKENMMVTSTIERGSRTYYKGILEHHEIVLVFSKWGKVAAASTTTTLIDYFNCKSIIFTGVAGGIDSALNIGDIVIGTSAYQHDLDARPFFDQFQIPLTDKIFISASYELELFEKAAADFLNNITVHLSSEVLSSFSISQPKLAKGIIASGDKFITNTLEYPNFISPKGLASAVEMEGAAVAQICDDHQIPFIIIRTISDKADHSAVIDFQKFIKDIAGAYSFGVIKKFLGYLNLRHTEDLVQQCPTAHLPSSSSSSSSSVNESVIEPITSSSFTPPYQCAMYPTTRTSDFLKSIIDEDDKPNSRSSFISNSP